MKRYLGILGVLFSIALNVAFVGSYAYQRVSRRQTFVYEALQLSPAQRAQWLSGRDRFIEKIDRIGNNITGLQLKLIDAVAVDPVDRGSIDATHDRIRAEQQLMQQTVVEHLLEEKAIINPEQRKEFFAVLKRRIQTQSRPGPPWFSRDRTRQP